MKFKSKHELTISFSAEGFDKLMSKEWSTIDCHMVSGRVIPLTRNEVLQLWCKTRDWRKVPHSATLVKILKIA